MADYNRELTKILRQHGCYEKPNRGKGSHALWFSPINGKSFTVQQGLYRVAANQILKQAGIAHKIP